MGFLGDLLREQNDFDGAERLLAQGMQVVTDTNIVGSYSATVGYIALARLRQARGDASGAMSALDDFVTLSRRRRFATAVLAHAAASRAHLWLLQGNLTAAARWADRSGIGPHDAPSFPREAEYCVLARVLIAKKDRAVLGLLQRLLGEAEARGRMGSAIEILGLLAVALRAFHDTPAAMAALERALTLAEPERYVRVFVDEGAPMLTLLRRARSQGIAPEYTAILLRAFQQPASAIPPGPEGSSPSWSVSVRPDSEEPLVEPQ